jgi:hypothetical protein
LRAPPGLIQIGVVGRHNWPQSQEPEAPLLWPAGGIASVRWGFAQMPEGPYTGARRRRETVSITTKPTSITSESFIIPLAPTYSRGQQAGPGTGAIDNAEKASPSRCLVTATPPSWAGWRQHRSGVGLHLRRRCLDPAASGTGENITIMSAGVMSRVCRTELRGVVESH